MRHPWMTIPFFASDFSTHEWDREDMDQQDFHLPEEEAILLEQRGRICGRPRDRLILPSDESPPDEWDARDPDKREADVELYARRAAAGLPLFKDEPCLV